MGGIPFPRHMTDVFGDRMLVAELSQAITDMRCVATPYALARIDP
jgi:hypothetical protein